jgi:hypothetical protein
VNTQLLKTIALIAFLAGGLLLVRAGALPLWLWCLLAVLVIVMRMVTRLDAPVDTLEISAEHITRTLSSKMRRPVTEAVRWDELSKVDVLARETGPDKQEPLFLLYGASGAGVAVPGPLARQHDLGGLLRQRLPGFDEGLLAQALAATERGRYTLWQKDG